MFLFLFCHIELLLDLYIFFIIDTAQPNGKQTSQAQSPVKKEPTPNNYNGEYNINTNSFFQSRS